MLVLLIGASIFWWRARSPVQKVGVVGGGALVFNQGSAPTTSGGLITGGTITFKAGGEPSQPPVDPEFQKWLERAAGEVNKTNVAGDRVMAEMARVAANLTPAQANQLLQTAVSNTAPAAEKILSVYLLGEGGARSRAQLVELILSPLPDRGPVTVHSPAETLSAGDRARVMMAVEALAAQAKSDPAALQALVQAISAIQDPNVKRLAQKVADEIRGR